ncbi:hypothetical protein AX15_004919 [Amanita polypyramis BW_CC]|nr:hypothetical protein AX15_004919 [Amanita polypyramis BW_CC]
MFKKFSPASDVSGQTPLKSSVQRSIRAAILSQWKIEPETLEVLWPKKETLTHVKCRDYLSVYTAHGEPIFFQHSEGPFYPTLRVLHRCASHIIIYPVAHNTIIRPIHITRCEGGSWCYSFSSRRSEHDVSWPNISRRTPAS